jgi:hypothetical protein
MFDTGDSRRPKDRESILGKLDMAGIVMVDEEDSESHVIDDEELKSPRPDTI